MNKPQFNQDDLILVTGAGSGIGKALSLMLNDQGAKIIGIGRSEKNLAQTKSDCKNPDIFFYETKDLSQNINDIEIFVKELVQKYGKISGFVHAAGTLNPQPLRIFNYDDCLQDFNTNLFSAIMLTKEISNKKNRQENLNIVYVSSITAKIGNPGSLTYALTKSSLNALVTTLAQEIGSKNIRINSVMPGAVDTDMAAKYNDIVNYDYFEKIKEKTAFKEIAKPEYIAQIILFLLSPQSYWIQGQNIIADGGESLS